MDDYLSTSMFQIRRALDDINRGVRETVYDAPKRYQQGGVGEVVFGSPAWEALQVASQARVPVPVRVSRAEGGGLPYFAQGHDDVDAALRIASQPKVRYDEGPQPGEQGLRAYDPTLRERAAQWMTGDSPTPERERFVQGLTGSTGLGHGMGIADFVPGVGQAFQMQEAARAGDNKSLAMAMVPGAPGARGVGAAGEEAAQQMLKGYTRQLTPLGLYSHAAEVAANLPQAKGTYEQMMAMLRKAGVRDEELRWAGVQEALGNKPVVTQEELAKHFHEKLPKLEETTLGAGEPHKFGTQEEQLAAKLRFDNARSAVVASSTPEDIAAAGDELRAAESNMRRVVPGWGIREGGREREPKFSQYTLPGGENYREVVLGLPTKGQTTKGMFGNDVPSTPDEAKLDHRSSHWEDIPNVVAHLRMADRTGPGGEKILHVEELQSDWAKEGQKKGFLGADTSQLRQKLNGAKRDFAQAEVGSREYDDAYDRITAARHELAQAESGVPSAPYVAGSKNDWLDLALKRALREAAAGGYDKMVWTPGEAQAARYDLSKQISEMWLTHNRDGAGVLEYSTPSGQKGRFDIRDEKHLEDAVGKDIAKKLYEQGRNNNGMAYLPNADLRVGGEGMKTFYDRVVPSQLSKILKKLDPEVKVGKHELRVPAIGHGDVSLNHLPASMRTSGRDSWYFGGSVPEELKDVNFASKEEAQRALDEVKERGKSHHVHSIPITPRMRETIMKGLPAYAAGGAVTDQVEDALRLAASHRGSKK